MIAAVWLMLSGLFCSLQLQTGSFPKPLTEQEERHYLELSAQGDLEARNILIERNLRLVAHIMKKYYTQTSDQEDLISIGTIGLIKGITTFDISKGARLATYAARCVENAILSWIRGKQIDQKTRSGMGHFRSSFCVVAICTALSRMMDFWKTGQFSAFSCCVAKSVWRSHTCRDNSSSPALVWGYRTVRLNDLPFEIGITSRGICYMVTKDGKCRIMEVHIEKMIDICYSTIILVALCLHLCGLN